MFFSVFLKPGNLKTKTIIGKVLSVEYDGDIPQNPEYCIHDVVKPDFCSYTKPVAK